MEGLVQAVARPRRPLLLRVLVVLLAIMVAIAAPAHTYLEAQAIAPLVIAAGALLGSLLVAVGYVFFNKDDMTNAGAALWNHINTALKDVALSQPVREHYQEIKTLVETTAAVWDFSKNGVIRLSPSALAALRDVAARGYDAIKGVFSSDSTVTEILKVSDISHDYPVWAGQSIQNWAILGDSYQLRWDDTTLSVWVNGELKRESNMEYHATWRVRTGNPTFYGMGITGSRMSDNAQIVSLYYGYPCDYYSVTFDSYGFYEVGFFPVDGSLDSTSTVDVSVPATAPIEGADVPDKPINIPVVDSGTGTVVGDVPLTQEGVFYPDIPDDKLQTFPVDTPIPKTDADAGTWEGADNPPVDVPDTPADTPGILQGLWDWLKGIVQGIADGITSIAGAIGGFFDSPSNFRLNFDGFKNLIVVQKFPFCIPFDFVNAVRLFAATAADYQLQIDIDTDYLQVHHTVDLSPFAVPLAFFRYAACIWFGFILVMRTRDLIKW